MSAKYGIDEKTRFLVLYLDAQMCISGIARIINRSRTILKKWEERLMKGDDIRIRKKRSKNRNAIPDETENKIIQMVKENPEQAPTTKIADRLGITSSFMSRLLAKKGFKFKAFDKGIIYKKEDRAARLAFCKKMLSDGGRLIYRTFFSDELEIELNKNCNNEWQLPAEKVKKKSGLQHVKLNCWGAISAKGATSLDIYPWGINEDRYQQVIEHHQTEMRKLYPDGEFCIIQDNHPPTHKINEEWIIKEQGVEFIQLPRRSSDLNIIETLWSTLRERVAGDAPINESELRTSLLNHWKVLTKLEKLQSFFEGLHRRYMGCIAKEGKKHSRWLFNIE